MRQAPLAVKCKIASVVVLFISLHLNQKYHSVLYSTGRNSLPGQKSTHICCNPNPREILVLVIYLLQIFSVQNKSGKLASFKTHEKSHWTQWNSTKMSVLKCSPWHIWLVICHDFLLYLLAIISAVAQLKNIRFIPFASLLQWLQRKCLRRALEHLQPHTTHNGSESHCTESSMQSHVLTLLQTLTKHDPGVTA